MQSVKNNFRKDYIRAKQFAVLVQHRGKENAEKHNRLCKKNIEIRKAACPQLIERVLDTWCLPTGAEELRQKLS